MKLLLDENLPPRLAAVLSESFPGSLHVSRVGLSASVDEEIWEFARANDFALVSKDSDFQQLSFVRGHPPKIIWIRRGNCSVADLEHLLLASVDVIREFNESRDASVLLLS
ncbi:MAG: DUF5615 family PIN-like protein [Longimicrobiales bacterium]